jgi:hypothetical protein
MESLIFFRNRLSHSAENRHDTIEPGGPSLVSRHESKGASRS